MKLLKPSLVLGVLALFGSLGAADAQQMNAIIVPSCGSQSYVVGQYRPPTMDTTGLLCTFGTGGTATNVMLVNTGSALLVNTGVKLLVQ